MELRCWKRACSILFSLALMSVVLSGCENAETPIVSSPTIFTKQEIIIGHVYSDAHNVNKACLEFEDYVEKQTGSALQVTIMPNSILGGNENMLEMCALGNVTLVTPSLATMEMYAPEWSIVSLPYLFSSAEQMYAALDGALGDYLKATLEDTEYICLGFNSNGIRNMSNNVRPITKVEDLQGITMRVMNNATYETWMKALGANAVPMSFNDVFDALSQGIVQGQENSASLTYDAKFYEVQTYYSITEHVYDMNAIICNRDFYEHLSPAEKEIFDYAISKYLIKHQRQMEAEENDMFIQLLADSGMEINILSAETKEGFQEALFEVYANSRATLGDAVWALVEKYQ